MITRKKLLSNAEQFSSKLSYQNKGRNWGNKWHSLCSYRGKLKPAIAHELISQFTEPGDLVLDPMGGVGTIAFEAILQGRQAISNDLSKLAQVVTQAKLNPVNKEIVSNDIKLLSNYIEIHKSDFSENEEVKNFGLNKKIDEYYHPETLKELLASREYFLSKDNLSNSEAFILSSLLHILHGNRPYALSRNSHPLTPYAPSGDFIYKNVIQHIQNKIDIMYNSKDFYFWGPGESLQYNALELSHHIQNNVDIIITSPPFASSFRFYTQNWLRLWFVGWTPEDFSKADLTYFDEQQNRNLDIYYKYFEECSKVLKNNGKMILHLGKSIKIDMATELQKRAMPYFNFLFLSSEDVSTTENHGVVDKGATTDHQFLFLEKK
ncbi:DNA methyltransferase [Streptococcus alactolyticus]|uniref:DNA methyltransferase n=1 Tax=Streptococcus alactolyticus TaxID=29389 RepID=UPI003F98C359